MMMHKNYLFVIGLLVFIAGVLPFLKQIDLVSGYIEMIPSSGLIYQIFIMALGAIAMFLSKPARRIYGYP